MTLPYKILKLFRINRFKRKKLSIYDGGYIKPSLWLDYLSVDFSLLDGSHCAFSLRPLFLEECERLIGNKIQKKLEWKVNIKRNIQNV